MADAVTRAAQFDDFSTLPQSHDIPPPVPGREHFFENAWQFIERHRRGNDRIKVSRLQVGHQAAPDFPAALHRTVGRSDTENTDTTQDG